MRVSLQSIEYLRLPRFLSIAIVAMCTIGVSACTTTKDAGTENSFRREYSGYNDPFEKTNRMVFDINDSLDHTFVVPVAKGYRSVVPCPARKGIRNFLRNLRSPVNIANQLLQGDVEGFAGDTSRMIINSTFGIGGLIDVASDLGISYEYEDFGQTLGVWGVGHGPYLVMPVVGPNSLRDHIGLAVDSYADPLRLYLFNTEQEGWYYGRLAMTGIDKREELLETLDDMRRNSLDYYAAMRSIHYQYRESLVQDASETTSVSVDIPDYDDEEEY